MDAPPVGCSAGFAVFQVPCPSAPGTWARAPAAPIPDLACGADARSASGALGVGARPVGSIGTGSGFGPPLGHDRSHENGILGGGHPASKETHFHRSGWTTV